MLKKVTFSVKLISDFNYVGTYYFSHDSKTIQSFTSSEWSAS